jgi:hypothetical protein
MKLATSISSTWAARTREISPSRHSAVARSARTPGACSSPPRWTVADDWDQRTWLCLWHRIRPPQSSEINYIRALG